MFREGHTSGPKQTYDQAADQQTVKLALPKASTRSTLHTPHVRSAVSEFVWKLNVAGWAHSYTNWAAQPDESVWTCKKVQTDTKWLENRVRTKRQDAQPARHARIGECPSHLNRIDYICEEDALYVALTV